MVFCTYCGHSFTRDEHLERHILTHTNVKPFKCFTCHMSFARRDLLQRHYTVHGRNQNQQEIPAANGMMPKSAGRTPIACSNCAKTKTKCDKKFPCSRCAGRNLRCTLRPTRRSTKNAARMGLITPETLAQEFANGNLPPDQTIAAEKVALPSGTVLGPEGLCHSHGSPPPNSAQHTHHSSPCASPPSSGSRSNSHGSDVLPPQMFDQFNGCPTPPEPPGMSPSTPPLGHAYPSSTQLGAFDDFSMQNKDASEEPNPHFMLDWQQLQMPMSFDHMGRTDMMMGHGLGFDMNAMVLDQQMDPTMSINPELTSMPPPLITPIESPKLERAYSDVDLINAGMSRQSTRHGSMISLQSMDGLPPSSFQHMQMDDPIVAAQDGWNTFCCTPPAPPGACPTTARYNLETLEQSLRTQELWSSWSPDRDDSMFQGSEPLAVMQLHESTRDKLLAITQGFLHKALEIHRGTENHSYAPSNFILLPPARVLEYFLRSYANSFEHYYPVTKRGALDANELMHCYHDKASSLLILLMIAQGANNIPSPEARSLTGGLVEACRISLFDLIEKSVAIIQDQNVLHAALLFTSLAAWSGDKWQMDISMGQKGIYTAMLRHSGMMRHALPVQQASPKASNQDQLWNTWMQQESRSRLVYSWAIVDQETALFQDTAPVLSVTEFEIGMPHSDDLWQAKSAGEWASVVGKAPDASSSSSTSDNSMRTSPASLRDLFRRFLDDEMDSIEHPLTPLHLRLLLHPIQSMVCHYSQMMTCFSDAGSSRVKSKTVTASSTRCRVEEVQCLLQRWDNLAAVYLKSHASCAIMQSSLVLYHLITLNTVTDFKQIEALARRETFDGTYQSLVWTHKRCISDVGEAVFHCGQTLRIVRSMPKSTRPLWWAAAIYRASLVLWCDSLINKDGSTSYRRRTGQAIAIDALRADHPLITRYLNKGEGVPCLSKRDGSTIAIDHGVPVLNHCIELLDEGSSTRFQEGIRAKLDRLMRT